MTGSKNTGIGAKEGKHLSAVPGGQKVGPDVERLIGQLEEAQDAVSGWTAGVSVAGDDAVLMENLEEENFCLVLSQFNEFVKPIFP